MTAVRDKARALGLVVVMNFFERDGDRTYDSSPVIDADGSLLGVTRMVHITEYPCFHEQGYYTPGDTGAPVYRTRAGTIGVAICYDRHYPEYMRALAIGGADLVIVPQAGTAGEWPEGLYEGELRVAALQNGYHVALCNRVGREDRLEFSGESFVCDPGGHVIARAGLGRDEILIAEIDPAAAGTISRAAVVPEASPARAVCRVAGAVIAEAIRNQEPGIRDLGSGIRDQGSGIRDQSTQSTVTRSRRSPASPASPHHQISTFWLWPSSFHRTRDRMKRSNSHNWVSRFEYGPGV